MAADLVVIGGGKMGAALVGGLLGGGSLSPTSVAVVEADPARRSVLTGSGGLAARFDGLAVVPAVAEVEVERGFGAVIAVKPADVAAACGAVASAGPARVLSIAAGVTLARLCAALATSSAARPDACRAPAVLRAMPNTPVLVGAGAAGLAASEDASPEDLAWAEGILGSVGMVVRVGEGLLDAVTGLSGSGPAYVFLVAEALIDAGVLVGLSRPVSEALTVQTLFGAARMLAEGQESPAALRAAVTSPGGTTAAGLKALEDRGLRAAISDAVVAATERSRQLGA